MKKIFLTIILCWIMMQISYAQQPNDAGSYMTYISLNHRGISKDFVSYVSAVAHGKSARKVSKRRDELLKTNREAIQKIQDMKGFEGDKSLRDSARKFLEISYHVLNEDYGKIMDLEAIAEQSYDAMEAYLLAQEIAGNKIKEAGESLKVTEKTFAEQHKITLVQSDDDLSKKIEKINKVNEYYQPIYLIFFKSYKQEMYLLEAFKNKDVSAIEQNNNSLNNNALEGLKKLQGKPNFQNDASLLVACKQLQEFYKEECKHLPQLTSYLIKEDNFQKIKKAFESKKESERTKQDVDQFNKAVADINKSGNEFNQVNIQLNNKRNALIENWNKASNNFLDKHTPR